MGEFLRRGIEIIVAPLQVTVEVIESPPGWQVLRLVAEVPFSQGPGHVALLGGADRRGSSPSRRGRNLVLPVRAVRRRCTHIHGR